MGSQPHDHETSLEDTSTSHQSPTTIAVTTNGDPVEKDRSPVAH